MTAERKERSRELRGGQRSLFPEDASDPSCSTALIGDRGPCGQVVPRAVAPREPRTIHYLGSKLRLLGPIREAIADLVSPGGKVCDLFAGSGAVALGLSPDWKVTSVDIQEYSRVLCSALLCGGAGVSSVADEVRQAAAAGSLRMRLRTALAELMEYEARCLQNAVCGDPAGLCDLMEYGAIVGVSRGVAVPSEALNRRTRAAWNRLVLAGLGAGAESVMTRNYGGVFFTWEQAIEFDSLLEQIHSVEQPLRDGLLAAVLAVASEVVNTVGKQFAQPIKPRNAAGTPKRHLISQTIRDRSIAVGARFDYWVRRISEVAARGEGHRAMRADYNDALRDPSLNFDVVYADPPYTRDHYSRYYHVLETMALHDEPDVSTTKIRSGGVPRLSRGLYRSDRHQSPFCIKSRAPGAFEELCSNVAARGVPLVLSYSPYRHEAGNRPRLLTMEELVAIVSRHFRDVDYRPVSGVSHNKLNIVERNVQVDYHAEVLLVCS